VMVEGFRSDFFKMSKLLEVLCVKVKWFLVAIP